MDKFLSYVRKNIFEIILIFSAFILFFLMLIKMPIFDGDTFYYIAKAKKMLATSDWFNTLSFMAKPIIGIWAMALTYKFFGVSLFTTYLGHSLFAAGSLLVVYKFLLETASRRAAQVGTAVLLTSLMFFYQTCSPMLDIPMIFFLILAQYFLYRFVVSKENKYLYGTALIAGLNFLTKGLTGVVIIGATFLFYLIFNRINPFKEYKNFIVHALVALLIFIAAISIWLVPQIQAHGQPFIELLYRENIVRFFQPIDKTGGYREVSSGAQHDPHLNIIYLFLAFLPWSALIVPVIWAAFKNKFYNQRQFFIFLLCWFGFVLVASTLTGHYKGPRYLLPLLPPLAMMVALYSEYIFQNGKIIFNKAIRRTYLWLGIIMAILALYILVTNFQHGENQYKPFVLTFLGSLAMVQIIAYWQLKRATWGSFFNKTLILTLVSYIIFLSQGNYYLKKVLPSYVIAEYVKKNLQQEQVAVWQLKERFLDFYLNRKVDYYSQAEELIYLQKAKYVITDKPAYKQLKKMNPGQIVKQQGEWLVVKLSN